MPLWGHDCPFLALTAPCLLVSGEGWAGPHPASSPLVFAQSFVLWAGLAVPQVRSFLRIVLSLSSLSLSLCLSLSLSLWLSHSLGCHLTLAPSDCPQGIWALSLLSAMQPATPVQPPLSGSSCECWEFAVRHKICGVLLFIYLFIYFSSQLCCPLRFQDSPQNQWWECFLVFGNFPFKTPFPVWISIPTSFVSLFIFYILSYLLSKTMSCLSGCLMSSASIQKLFCGIHSALKCSFEEFVGEKVVSLSYSSAIFVTWLFKTNQQLSK